jgi:imidazolonepropionase-like amidohydrolase
VRRKFSQKQLLPAREMGLDKNVGTIELGKHADMDADPLADIRNTRRIVKSISAGAAPLWESVDFKP